MTAGRRSGVGTGALMAAPAVIVMALVLLYPQIFSLILSLHQYSLANNFPFKFVGLANYFAIIREGRFLNSLGITFEFTAIVVFFDLLMGFLIAISIYRAKLWSRVLRSLYIIPMVFTPVVAGILWRLILSPSRGVINYWLLSMGIIQSPIPFLGLTQTAFPWLCAIEVWRSVPFVMIVMLAGLSALPEEPFEAARLDGARGHQIIRFITLPMLRPVILLVALIRAMDAFRSFDLIYVMTRGGPGDSTKTLTMYAYETGFIFLDIGKSSAISYVITVVLLMLSITFIRQMTRRNAGGPE